MYVFLCAHLCLWYWRAVWERAVCHLAANAPALPRHVLPNRWTKRATMRKQSVLYKANNSAPELQPSDHFWAPQNCSLSSDKWMCVGVREQSSVIKTVDPDGNSVNLNSMYLTIQKAYCSWQLTKQSRDREATEIFFPNCKKIFHLLLLCKLWSRSAEPYLVFVLQSSTPDISFHLSRTRHNILLPRKKERKLCQWTQCCVFILTSKQHLVQNIYKTAHYS